MVRLPRDAPTPAAVITYVALGTFAVSCALSFWDDALDQAAAGEWAWPVDPTSIARSAAWWALSVSLWCAVVWVASVRGARRGHPWRAAGLGATIVVAWAFAAGRSFLQAFMTTGWYVPWPGPVPGLTYLDPHDPQGEPSLALRPGVLVPIALVATLAVVALLARRHAIRHPEAERVSPSPAARRTALAVLLPPAVAALVAATLVQVPDDDSMTALQRYVDGVVNPGAGLALAVLAALLLGGAGAGGWILLGVVQLSVVGPPVLAWLRGGPDLLLATAALGTLAVALAAAVRPAAAALPRLDEGAAGASVPEGAHADDRAWA